MSKSEFASQMDAVIAELSPYLKSLRYKKRGRTFNREWEPGLVHVINFQMGAYEFNVPELPPYRYNLYGWFTVNLGVYLAEINEILRKAPSPNFISEPKCEFRQRLGSLVPPFGGDLWWNLNAAVPRELGAEIFNLLNDYGLPYLDTFKSRETILSDWYSNGITQKYIRSGLLIAVMLSQQGKIAEAKNAFQDYKEQMRNRPHAKAHIIEMANRLGFPIENEG